MDLKLRRLQLNAGVQLCCQLSIPRHLQNIFDAEELDVAAPVVAESKIYDVDYYNLDAILSVG